MDPKIMLDNINRVADDLIESVAPPPDGRDARMQVTVSIEKMVLRHQLFVAEGKRLGWPRGLLIEYNKRYRFS